MQPLFSILMANYNNGRYLMEAVESVRSQTYPNWELIIVDDGSTDESRALYELLADDGRIRVFYNDRNMGCAYTKHQCVLHALGEMCGYLDPDDVLLPDAIALTVDNLQTHSEAVLSMSRYYFCDAELNITSESRLLKLEDGESYLEHHDYMPEVFAGWYKDSYMKAGGLNTFFRAAVDQDLYFRLEEQGKIAVLDAFTYKYRILSDSVSRDDRRSFFWNQMARFEACERRGIASDHLVYADFVDHCDNEYRTGAADVRHSKSYRLGCSILKIFGKR